MKHFTHDFVFFSIFSLPFLETCHQEKACQNCMSYSDTCNASFALPFKSIFRILAASKYHFTHMRN